MAKIMERTYICANGVVETTRYAVGDRTGRRGRKKGKTSLRKEEQNFNLSIRKVARILNCNYSHENGLLLTLDYDEDGMKRLIATLPPEQQEILAHMALPKGEIGTWSTAAKKVGARAGDCCVAGAAGIDANGDACENGELVKEALDGLRAAAEHQMMLWLRRIKRKYSGKLKALLVTSDVNHETGELVRVHHHVPLAAEGISWDLLQEEWKHGSVDIRRLRDQPDYTPIAVYLMRQVRKQPEKKKYRVTQGMEQPYIAGEREVMAHVEIKPPAGARVLERSEFSVDSVGQYIRYIPKKKEYRRKRTAEGKEVPPNEV